MGKVLHSDDLKYQAYQFYVQNELVSLREIEKKFGISRGVIREFIYKNNLIQKDRKELLHKLNTRDKRCNTYTIPDYKQLKVLEGFILSDGGIYKATKGNTARIQITNIQKQFCDYALNTLPFGGKVRLSRTKQQSIINGYNCTIQDTYCFYSKADLYLEDLHSKWYKDKIKVIPEDFSLDSTQVLIWFLGDGYSHLTGIYHKRYVNIGLCVNNFSLEEITKLINLFAEIDIEFRVAKANKGTKYVMCIYKKQSIDNFYNYIEKCPEELSSFQYKWKQGYSLN